MLLTQKVTVLAEYSNFANIFSKKLAKMLPEWTGINEHAIELVNGKKPPYRPIYSLGTVAVKTLKTYIQTNLANHFIWP